MRTNSFTLKTSKKSNHELETILEEKSNYTEEAIQAVIWELENRNLREKSEVLYEEFPKENNFKDSSLSKKVLENNESAFEESVLPVLYSKKAIQVFTIFFATLFGAILLMQNLKEMNKPKARIQVLVFAMLYAIFTAILFSYFPKTFVLTLIFNIVGYAVLIEFFWNKNLGKEIKYRKKPIWKPLIISIAILILFVFLQFSPQIVDV